MNGASPPPRPEEVVLPTGERFVGCPDGTVMRGYPLVREASATYCATTAEPSRRHGPFESFYPDGKVLAKGMYDHGNPDGAWTTYHQNGQVLSQGQYVRGVRDGAWKFARPDGRPVLEEDLTGGARTSWVEYDYDKDALVAFESFAAVPGKGPISQGRAGRTLPGGNVLTGQFGNDKGEGLWEEKAPKGDIVLQLTMSAGFAEGSFAATWPATHKPSAQGQLLKTLPQGTWTLAYPSGDKLAEVRYEKGLLRSILVYHANGQKRLSGELLDGAPHATWSVFHPDGSVETSGAYARGVRQGMWRTADSTGKPVAEGLYENGVLIEGQRVDPIRWSTLGLAAALQDLFTALGFITAGRGKVELDQRALGECMLFGDPAEKCLSLDWENTPGAHKDDGAAEIERRNKLQDLACAVNDPAACARAGKRIVDSAAKTPADAKKAVATAAGYYQKACDLSPDETAWKARDATGKAMYKGFHSATACLWLGKLIAEGEVKSKAQSPADLYKQACDQGVEDGCKALADVPAKAASKPTKAPATNAPAAPPKGAPPKATPPKSAPPKSAPPKK